MDTSLLSELIEPNISDIWIKNLKFDSRKYFKMCIYNTFNGLS